MRWSAGASSRPTRAPGQNRRDVERAREFDNMDRLGWWRRAVERTLAAHRFRRLPTGHGRRADIHQAFLSLACALICQW